MKREFWYLLGALAVAFGCDDPLKAVDRIEEPRVLAARVEVDGDIGRVSPVPGETVHVTWLVASPNGDALSGMGLYACAARARNRGLLECDGAPFASVGTGPDSELPSFTFVVPADLDPTLHPYLLVQGRLCPAATGSVDGAEASCSDGAGLGVSTDFSLERAGASNTNPTLPNEGITFDGAVWPVVAIPSGGCQGLGFPEVSRTSGEHTIGVDLPGSARDELVQTSSADSPREALQIANFVSAGELDHVFTNILPTSTTLQSRVRFNPIVDADASGTIVRTWFVVRDGRGGSDFTERTVCVLP